MKIININKRKIRLFFTGFTMGLSDLVPGVSSGTIALLFGIYDELLYIIKLVTGRVPKLFIAGKFKEAFQLIPFAFLLPLSIGLGLAILGLVQVVSFLLNTYPVLIWSFFFGLVLGSVFIVSKRISNWTFQRALLALIGFILTFIVVGLSSLGGSVAPLAVLGTGAIAVTAMILPGISGSLIMVLLGQYEVIISAAADRDLFILTLFVIGAIAGLTLFVRLLTWFMKHYRLEVIAFLIGVMTGSLREIWPWKATDISGSTSNVLPLLESLSLWAALLIAVGFVGVFMLERVGIVKEHDDIKTRDFEEELKRAEK